MEIKVLRGSRLDNQTQQISMTPQMPSQQQSAPMQQHIQPQQPEMQSNDSSLLGRLGISLLKGIDAPVDFIDTLNMALGEPSLRRGPKSSEQLINKLNYSPEQQEPRNIVERYGHKFLQQAPTAALFGAPALGRAAISAIPSTGVGELGAPDWLQDLTQFGADIGIGSYQGKFTGIKGAQKKAYDVARSLIKEGEKPYAEPVVKGLTEVGKSLATETDSKTVKAVEHVLETVKKNLNYMFEEAGKISSRLNPKTAMDLRRKIYKTTSKNKDLLEYTKPITEGINNFFSQYAIENPDFYNALTKADKLTEARNMVSYVDKLIEAIPLSGDIGVLGKSAAKGTLGKLFGGTEKIIRRIATNPAARNVYFDLGKAAIAQDPALVTRKLNDVVETFNQPSFGFIEAPSKPLPKGFKVVKGQKIS